MSDRIACFDLSHFDNTESNGESVLRSSRIRSTPYHIVSITLSKYRLNSEKFKFHEFYWICDFHSKMKILKFLVIQPSENTIFNNLF